MSVFMCVGGREMCVCEWEGKKASVRARERKKVRARACVIEWERKGRARACVGEKESEWDSLAFQSTSARLIGYLGSALDKITSSRICSPPQKLLL